MPARFLTVVFLISLAPIACPQESASASLDEEVRRALARLQAIPDPSKIRVNPEDYLGPRVAADVDQQLAFIEARLREGKTPGSERFPAGRLFCHTFFGCALVNACMIEPGNEERGRKAAGTIKWLIETMEADKEIQASFAPSEERTPPRGIIYEGNLNLLRAGLLFLERDPAVEHRFREDSARLAALYNDSPTFNLETWKGAVWPVDNLSAILSLTLCDALCGTDYGKVGEKWIAWQKAHLHADTGLMYEGIDAKTETPAGRPRGCALSWSLAFLAGIDPAFAGEQYAAYRKKMGVSVFGLAGFREFPPGDKGTADADSGPVHQGAGMAATGFGVAAARVLGDRSRFRDGLIIGEIAGNPRVKDGEKSYLGGNFLLLDTLYVWAKTHGKWKREQDAK
ncbi:MAG: hypothetical protein HYY93_10945 [Planctomycetes bacterium]|nr:hypothetical protein [Planctomycetota bacterium]